MRTGLDAFRVEQHRNQTVAQPELAPEPEASEDSEPEPSPASWMEMHQKPRRTRRVGRDGRFVSGGDVVAACLARAR